jgi:hypothetical protein
VENKRNLRKLILWWHLKPLLFRRLWLHKNRLLLMTWVWKGHADITPLPLLLCFTFLQQLSVSRYYSRRRAGHYFYLKAALFPYTRMFFSKVFVTLPHTSHQRSQPLPANKLHSVLRHIITIRNKLPSFASFWQLANIIPLSGIEISRSTSMLTTFLL